MQLQKTLTPAALLFLAACATSRPQANYSPFHLGEAAPMAAAAPMTTATAISATKVALVDSTEVPLVDSIADESVDGDAIQGGPPRGRAPKWRNGGAMLTGYFGATTYDLKRESNGTSLEANDVDLPSIGGGGQFKLGGDKIDFGLEGLIGFNWRAGSTAVAVGGGGAAVAVDVDVFVLDLYGGPFVNIGLGDAARVYVGAGPLMQWAWYEETLYDDGSGFGLGYYARTGIEFHLGRGSMIGAGVRWSENEIDLGGRLGDLQADGLLWMITYSYFY